VSLEETSVVGNVYFVHYVRWQGRCREAFIREHAPEAMQHMGPDLALATTRVACTYYRELSAFDEVLIRMHAADMTPSRLTIAFSCFRTGPRNSEELVAEGEQEIVCMQRIDGRMQVALLPEPLREAVQSFMSSLSEELNLL